MNFSKASRSLLGKLDSGKVSTSLVRFVFETRHVTEYCFQVAEGHLKLMEVTEKSRLLPQPARNDSYLYPNRRETGTIKLYNDLQHR